MILPEPRGRSNRPLNPARSKNLTAWLKADGQSLTARRSEVRGRRNLEEDKVGRQPTAHPFAGSSRHATHATAFVGSQSFVEGDDLFSHTRTLSSPPSPRAAPASPPHISPQPRAAVLSPVSAALAGSRTIPPLFDASNQPSQIPSRLLPMLAIAIFYAS